MMRVISGQFKGRQIPLPDPSVARPSTDKIRQAVFNIIEHRFLSKPWPDISILDAFAGSGSLGIEALSRGAASATFVETHKKTAEMLKAFIDKLNIKNTKVFQNSFFKAPLKCADVIFLDPPFDQNLWQSALEHIAAQNLLSNDGIIYLECEKHTIFDVPDGLSIVDERSMGRIKMMFLSKA